MAVSFPFFCSRILLYFNLTILSIKKPLSSVKLNQLVWTTTNWQGSSAQEHATILKCLSAQNLAKTQK